MFTQPLRYSWIISALVFAVCSTQKEPAQNLISDTEAAVNAAAPAAARYIPDQLAEVRSNLGALKADIEKKNYKGAIDSGHPGYLTLSATAHRLSARITP
jgi:hypothetical protein